MKRTAIFLMIVFIAGIAQARDAEDEARDLYRLGDVYYQQGRYKEAQDMFQKALDLLKDKPGFPKSTQMKIEERSVYPEEVSVKAAVKREGAVEYTIGEEDVLNISVWQNPDLDQEVTVRPDGMISFPLVGDVQAGGLTVTQLDGELTARLKEFIKYPEVSISLKKLGGKKVIVLGEVTKPGVYSVTGAKTVIEAIGLAGGFTNHAVAASVIVIRGGFTNPKADRINLTKALRGDKMQNVPLNSEDVIFVPKKFIANVNYFLNQILDPISRGVYTADELHNW